MRREEITLNSTTNNRNTKIRETRACPPWCVKDTRYGDDRRQNSSGTQHTSRVIRVRETCVWVDRFNWDSGVEDVPALVLAVGDDDRVVAELSPDDAEKVAQAMLELVQAAKQ